jgi:hypothetical protein
MHLETHRRAHRHVKLPDLLGAAQFRQIDDEAGRQQVGTDLPSREIAGCSRQTEFRELELRLLMGKLGASLGESVVGRLSATLRSGR